MNRASLLAVSALVAPACTSFISAAGEFTLAKEQGVPALAVDVPWPNIDSLVGSALTSANTQTAGVGVGGLPTSLASGTLAHVQGLMTIDGECRRSFSLDLSNESTKTTGTGAKTTAATASVIKSARGVVTNCGDPKNRCTEWCKNADGTPFQGMRLEMRIEFVLLDKAKAASLKKELGSASNLDTENADPIKAIRFKFSKLQFYQVNATKVPAGQKTCKTTSDCPSPQRCMTNKCMETTEENVNRFFTAMQFGAASPGGGDETPIVRGRYLNKISLKTPQVFALNPFSEFTKKLKKKVLGAEESSVEMYVKIAIRQQDLYSIKLGNSGIDLALQPELVVSAVEVIKAL
jgi:hypothetical protein